MLRFLAVLVLAVVACHAGKIAIADAHQSAQLPAVHYYNGLRALAPAASGLTAVESYYQNFAKNTPQKPATNGTIHWLPEVHFLLHQFTGMPHSYLVPDNYWRSEAYLAPGMHPVPLDSQVAIEDRVCTKFGLNLYDGATWEIGLSLQGEVELPRVYERTILYSCSTGTNTNVGGLADIKADSSLFLYGKNQTPGSALKAMPMIGNYSNPNQGGGKTIPGAFYFRMISQAYITEDPLIGSYARAFVYPDPNSSGPSWNTDGVIIWNDWKPITGENVWATMIGPLQNLYITFNGSIPMFPDYKHAPAQVQLGLSVLPALMALQSPMGSLYHCPKGTQMYPPDESTTPHDFFDFLTSPHSLTYSLALSL